MTEGCKSRCQRIPFGILDHPILDQQRWRERRPVHVAVKSPRWPFAICPTVEKVATLATGAVKPVTRSPGLGECLYGCRLGRRAVDMNQVFACPEELDHVLPVQKLHHWSRWKSEGLDDLGNLGRGPDRIEVGAIDWRL